MAGTVGRAISQHFSQETGMGIFFFRWKSDFWLPRGFGSFLGMAGRYKQPVRYGRESAHKSRAARAGSCRGANALLLGVFQETLFCPGLRRTIGRKACRESSYKINPIAAANRSDLAFTGKKMFYFN
jgi:hypothetical protein